MSVGPKEKSRAKCRNGRLSPVQIAEAAAKQPYLPKFYWDWLKETGSGYFRNIDSPNIKRQDGRKLPFLCADCEQRFSVWETATARNIFVPLVTDPARSAPYGDWFYKFLISVLWRGLALDLEERGKLHDEEFQRVEEEWQAFLLNGQPLTRYIAVYTFFVSSLLDPGSPFSSVYLCRDADFSIVTTSACPAGVYAKFANLIMWAEVEPADPQLWVNTAISETGGILLAGRQELRDPHIGSFLIGRSNIRKTAKTKLFAQMSLQQRTKLDQWKLENAERIANSKLMDAMLADVPVLTIVTPRAKTRTQ
jgi:hypothetical protein